MPYVSMRHTWHRGKRARLSAGLDGGTISPNPKVGGQGDATEPCSPTFRVAFWRRGTNVDAKGRPGRTADQPQTPFCDTLQRGANSPTVERRAGRVFGGDGHTHGACQPSRRCAGAAGPSESQSRESGAWASLCRLRACIKSPVTDVGVEKLTPGHHFVDSEIGAGRRRGA